MGVAGGRGPLEVALDLERDTHDMRARPGFDAQTHLVGLAGGATRLTLERDRGCEVALGLQKFLDLRRCGVDQPCPFALVDLLALDAAEPHDVEVALEQRRQRRRCVDLDLDAERRRRGSSLTGGDRHAAGIGLEPDQAAGRRAVGGGRLRGGRGGCQRRAPGPEQCQAPERENRQRMAPSGRPRCRARPAGRAAGAHLLSSRIAPSSPASVSGNIRWFISCWTIAMLCR